MFVKWKWNKEINQSINQSKRSSNRRNLKTPVLHFSFDGTHFEKGAFGNRRCLVNYEPSLPEFSSPKKR